MNLEGHRLFSLAVVGAMTDSDTIDGLSVLSLSHEKLIVRKVSMELLNVFKLMAWVDLTPITPSITATQFKS